MFAIAGNGWRHIGRQAAAGRTGFQAARLALAGFIIPFVFVYHPAVLYKLQVLFGWFGGEVPSSNAMIDIATVSWADLGWITLAFTLAMWLFASAIAGFEKNRLHPVERLLRVLAGGLVLLPDWTLAGIGLALALPLIVGHRFLGGTPSPIDTQENQSNA